MRRTGDVAVGVAQVDQVDLAARAFGRPRLRDFAVNGVPMGQCDPALAVASERRLPRWPQQAAQDDSECHRFQRAAGHRRVEGTSMIRGEASTTIRQPASTVFSFIVDDFLTNYPRWSPEVLALRPLSHGVLRVGFMAEQTRVDQGRRSTSTFRVTACDRDCRLHIAGISQPFRLSFELDAAGATTKITFAFELLKMDFFMRPFEKLIRSAIADGARGVVGNLKWLLEAQPQPQPQPLPQPQPQPPAAPDRTSLPPRQTMDFLASKDDGLIPFVLAQILDTCVNGITLSDPDQEDMPIVYANTAFERMSGYPLDEIIGRNCRFLQGADRDQPELETIRSALKEDRGVEVTLRNYRKSGEMFLNRLSIRPLVDRNGQLIYYLGVQYDVTAQVGANAEIDRLRLQLGDAPR
jgi:PAS domain S-box-containing protein